MANKPVDSTEAFENAVREADEKQKYILRLYVTGVTPKSQLAIANVKRICEEHLKGRYDLEVIDIYQQPVLARGEQIIATPTLIKKIPTPLRRFIGDMAGIEKILIGLDLVPKMNTSGANEKSPADKRKKQGK
jgi:circadian clock protein KaiB